MTVDCCRAAKLLLSHDNILLLTHKNPDGDTLCSAAALCLALRRAGRKAYLYPNPQITEKYLTYVLKCMAEDSFEPDFRVAVDVAAPDMFCKGYEGGADFCIDHHPTNPHYAENDCVYSEKSSCGEIVLEIIELIHGDVTKEEAELLYIAVSTDTGCFQYANTNSDTFTAAAKLLSYGADTSPLNVKFFRKVSKARIMLESMIYSGLYFGRGGELVIATITKEMMEKAGANEDDCDDIASLPGRVEGEKTGITIRELPDGTSKVSVRTARDVSASDICAVFGGGGHAMASGCTIHATPERARELLVAVVDEVCG